MKWTEKLLWLCFLVYTIAYFGKSGYSANISTIMDWYGVGKSAAGLVGTFFFFSYGCGQVLHGICCKFYPARFSIPAVLTISGIINLILFFQPPFAIYRYLWLLNGICLSVLWPSLVLVLSGNTEPKNFGRVTFVLGLTQPIGVFLTYGFSSFFNFLGDYTLIFLLAAVLTIFVAIIWIVEYPKATVAKVESVSLPTNSTESTKSSKTLLKGTIFFFALFGLIAAANNLMKDGLNTWAPAILKEEYQMTNSLSILLTLILPICGFLGTVLFLKLLKILPKDILLSAVFFLFSTIALGVLVLLTQNSQPEIGRLILFLFCFGTVFCLTSGLNNLISTLIPLRMKEKSGMVSGIMNGCCYVGSTLSSYTLGLAADYGGWNMVFKILFYIALVTTGILFICGRMDKKVKM